MDRPTFDEILERWLADNNGKIKGDINARVYLFFQLFAALEEHGYGKSEVVSHGKDIKGTCFCEHAKSTSAQKQKWKNIIETSYKRALVMYPPWQFKMATYDSDKTPIIPTQYPEIPESLNTYESVRIETSEYSEPTIAVQREEFDPEEWAKKPTPEPLYDPELRVLFGFKK